MLKNLFCIVLCAILVSCGEVKVSVIHEPPSVIITEPSEGSIFMVGESVLFGATAQSSSDDPSDMIHVWVSSNEQVCVASPVPADGKPTCVVKFTEAGEQTVTVTVTDSQNDVGSASVSVTIIENLPPSITILSPSNADTFTPDNLIVIRAEVSDPEDASHLLEVSVESSVDGVLPLSATPGTDGLVNDSTYLTAGTHLLTYTVTDTLGNTGSSAITVTVNSPPSAPVVDLLPDDAGTGDELVATITTESIDPEGDPITYYYEWVRNGSAYNNPTSRTLKNSVAPGVAAAGDSWEVFVYAEDGFSASTFGYDYVEIGNEPPQITGCVISPSDPESADDLTAVPLGWSDPDGDPEQYDYEWEAYDSSVSAWLPVGANASILPASFTAIGDEVRVICTPYNTIGSGFEYGNSETSTSVSISNSLPTMTSCDITPNNPSASDELVANAQGVYDHDGDNVTVAYTWEVNGALLSGETSSTLAVGNYERNDTVKLSCTPSDPTDTGIAAKDTVTIENAAPSQPVVTIEPASPATDEGLIASLDTPSVDPDGDAITYTYEWQRDGITYVPSGAANEIPSGVIVRNEQWSVSVIASDQSKSSLPGIDTVDVGNAPPTLSSCTISPTLPTVDDDLTAAGSGSGDPEGDTVSVGYSWLIDFNDGNGFVDIGVSNATLNRALTEEDYTIKAVCTPNDGSDDGTPVESAPVTLGNSPPSITSCDVTPTNPNSQDDLVVSHSGYYDPNGDPETVTYTWYLNGVLDTMITTDTYPGSRTLSGDVVKASCLPYDGDLYGTEVDSNVVTIGNAPPGVPSVRIEPETATSSDELIATIDLDAIDPDGDAVYYEYKWSMGGVSIGTSSTLDYSLTSKGDIILLEVTACDTFGDCGTVAGTDDVTIGNTPPELTTCYIDPAYPVAGEDLTAMASGAYDEDGDPITVSYKWYRDTSGGFVDTGITAQTTAGTTTAQYDTWMVECTPSDGTDVGTTVQSVSVVVGNAPPSLASCSLAPLSPTTLESITAVPSGATDPDGDDVSFQFKWFVNGIEDSTQTSASYPSTSTSKNDIIEADCYPDDGLSLGSPARSTQVTIQNSAPSLATFELSPDPASTSDNLAASAASPAIDPDGDSVTYTYSWSVNGVTAGIASSVVPSASTSRGELWEVEVVACDSDPITPLCSSPVTASITVGNALPTLSGCSVQPSAPTSLDDLSASPANWFDADGDGQQVLYEWFIDAGAGFVTTGVSDPSLSNAMTSRGDQVRVECTPFDNYGAGTTVVSPSVTILNSAPTLASCEVFNASPDSTTDVAVVTGALSDPDAGDMASVRYEWYVNGALDAAQTTATYPHTSTTRGQQIFARCFPTDGTAEGPYLQTSVATISNSAPSAPVISITPAVPVTTDALTVLFDTPSVDPDGDAVVYSYTWQKNSLVTGQSSISVASAYTSKGEIWSVNVIACDDYSLAPKCASIPAQASATIANAPPTLQSVSISPTTPTSLDDVVAAEGAHSDPDGDGVNFNIRWWHDKNDGSGFVVDPAEVTAVFPFAKTQKDDRLKAEFTPVDAPDGLLGSPVESGPVTVQNTPPSQPVVTIMPASPDDMDDLNCIYSGSTDADLDTITYDIAWIETTRGQSAYNVSILPSSETFIGDRWYCEVTPHDGTVDGQTGISSFVDVTDNTAPGAPVIAPIDPFRNDTSVDMEGFCEAGCDLTFYCSNTNTAWQESTTCSAGGTFTYSLTTPLSPGYNTTCYATCTDGAANESGASNQVMTEACLTVDPYENALGDGDSSTYAIDNWATMPDDGSVIAVVTGNILEEDSVWDVDWYRFDTSDNVTADMVSGLNEYQFSVALTQGVGTYSFLVYRGGVDPNTQLQCRSLINSGYTEYTFFAQDGGDGSHTPPIDTRECGASTLDANHNLCQDLGEVYYVEVLRDPAAVPSCQPYQLTVTNGP